MVGSSAGGEQPKFLADVLAAEGGIRSVLVKFSSADASPVSQRWADLLCCEHLAAQTLYAQQVPCARTQMLDVGGRRFLEVERYDRPNGAGRRGVVTLGAIEDAFVPEDPADWIDAARRLEAAQVISPADAQALQWRWCFGDLIGNTDMHRANASFWLGDKLPFSLAPAYDMVPMLYAPGAQGDLGERTLSRRPPLPRIAAVWAEAAVAAADFWRRVTADERISADFRAIAAYCADQIDRLRDRYRCPPSVSPSAYPLPLSPFRSALGLPRRSPWANAGLPSLPDMLRWLWRDYPRPDDPHDDRNRTLLEPASALAKS